MLVVAAAALGVVALSVSASVAGPATEAPGPSTTAVLDGSDHVNAWEAGHEMIERCDGLPSGYRRVEIDLPTSGALNVWAAGDAASARYLNHLLEVCPA